MARRACNGYCVPKSTADAPDRERKRSSEDLQGQVSGRRVEDKDSVKKDDVCRPGMSVLQCLDDQRDSRHVMTYDLLAASS